MVERDRFENSSGPDGSAHSVMPEMDRSPQGKLPTSSSAV